MVTDVPAAQKELAEVGKPSSLIYQRLQRFFKVVKLADFSAVAQKTAENEPKKRHKKTPRPIETTCLRVVGADSQIRTGDLILTKDALYRLSYISMLSFDNVGILSQRI